MLKNQASSKRTFSKSVLADLDGLLVDSKSFSQLFIQQCDPKWVENKLDKVAQSDIHLIKLIEVLTRVITSESHPEWVRKALVWLNCFMQKYPNEIQKPRIRNALKQLCSYVHEISGLENPYFCAANRSLAVEKWSKTYKSATRVPSNLYYSVSIPIPSTRYVYNDDSNLKPRSAKRKRIELGSNRSLNLSETEDLANEVAINSSFESESETLAKINDFDLIDEDDDDNESIDSSVESDDGVFDVDNPVSGDEHSDAENRSRADELIDLDDHSSESLDPEQGEENLTKEDYIVDDLFSSAESSNESTDDEDHDDERPLRLNLEDLGGKSEEDNDDTEDEAKIDDSDDEEEEQAKKKSESSMSKQKRKSPAKSPKKRCSSKSPSKPKSDTNTKPTPSTSRRSLRSSMLSNSDTVSSPSQPRTLRTRSRQNK